MVSIPCVVPENAQTPSGRFFGLSPPATLEISPHYPKKIPMTFPGMLRYFLALHLYVELIISE